MIPVLMYHHVHPAPLDPPPRHPGSYLTPEDFAAQLDRLAAWGFTTPTLAEAAAGVGDHRPRRRVVLTFDDGCRCFAEQVVPALRARGQRATVFAVSGALGGHNRWDEAEGERREALMDAGELAAVADAGMEVGSHGRGHRDLALLQGAELEAEVAGSRRDLEAVVGRPVTTFCYPWGRLSPSAREAVRGAGYAAAVSIHGHAGAAAGDRWAVPRMIVAPGEGRFELWLKAAGLYPAWSRLPRLGLLAALRRRGRAT
ncbi:MAG TPA: polysaccharide deacetylase family protein [Thermoanaerobaculia bacterium]|nr:polysaccharide deacetylase family protein [Thermoanaerobaculia bacterium]